MSEARREKQGALMDWAGVVLTPERAPLYEAIDARFAAMLAAGALDEARALAARGLDPLMPAMKAHGMPWLAAHFRGEMDLEAAADLAKRDTRRYAKRQFTWIANQMSAWTRIEAADPGARADAALAALR
jgi:tRNA dimethylallyltransferase